MEQADKEWKGYTIDELRYQKALALLKLEVQKERFSLMKTRLVSFPDTGVGKMFGKLFSSSKAITYVIAGYKVFSMINKFRKGIKK